MKRFVQTLVGIAIVGTIFLQPLFVVGDFVATNIQIAHAQTNPAAGGGTSGTTAPGQQSTGASIPGANPGSVEANAQTDGSKIDSTFACIFSGSGTFSGCIIQMLYYIVFVPIQFIAFIAAQFLDFFISYSINSESYRQAEFVERGWGIVRDLTNILFIFALLYIAFNFILNKESNAKKLLINVVLVGLAINFSLFMTRVIIDAGNVLANVLYNQITVTSPETGETPVVSDFNEKQISVAVVSQSNPQKIISNMEYDGSSIGAAVMTILAASLFALGLILLFGSMAFLFLGRTVGLMIQMIFSPIAFASNLFPSMPLEQFRMKNWFMETLKLSFLAPIFLFFLYLVILFLDASKKVVYPATNGSLGLIISVLLPYALTWAILQKGTQITKSMAGEAATLITKGLNMAGGMVTTAALGVATGGTAAIGRATLGRAGAAMAAKSAGKTNFAARAFNAIGNKAASSNFDFRSTAAAKQFQQRSGIKIGNQLTAESGGWRGMQNRFIAEQQRRANEFSAIGPNEKKFDQEIRNRETALEALRNRKGTKNANGVDIDKEYADHMKDLKKLNEDLKAADTDQDKKLIRNQIKAKKEDIRKTDKYGEIHAARQKVADAKKAKTNEEKKRREKFTNTLVPLGNPLFIASNTRDEALRRIRGDVDETEDKFGSPITSNTAASTPAQPAPANNTTQNNTNITNNITNNTTGLVNQFGNPISSSNNSYSQTNATASAQTQQPSSTVSAQAARGRARIQANQRTQQINQNVQQATRGLNTQQDIINLRQQINLAEQQNNNALVTQLEQQLRQVEINVQATQSNTGPTNPTVSGLSTQPPGGPSNGMPGNNQNQGWNNPPGVTTNRPPQP